MKEAERRGKGEKRKKWAKGKKEPSRNKEIYLVLGRNPVCQGEQDDFGNKESVWGLTEPYKTSIHLGSQLQNKMSHSQYSFELG